MGRQVYSLSRPRKTSRCRLRRQDSQLGCKAYNGMNPAEDRQLVVISARDDTYPELWESSVPNPGPALPPAASLGVSSLHQVSAALHCAIGRPRISDGRGHLGQGEPFGCGKGTIWTGTPTRKVWPIQGCQIASWGRRWGAIFLRATWASERSAGTRRVGRRGYLSFFPPGSASALFLNMSWLIMQLSGFNVTSTIWWLYFVANYHLLVGIVRIRARLMYSWDSLEFVLGHLVP